MTLRMYPAGSGAPVLLLAHGAGAGHGHPWMRRVGQGLTARGVAVATFDFPYIAAGRRIPDAGPVLERAFQDHWRELHREPLAGASVFAGGKSMGGRIASQVAAAGGFDPPATGLVFFGYPLHPPGRPSQRRDRHLPSIDQPMLFMQGTRDPFGSTDEMRALTEALPTAQLELIAEGDHSLSAAKRRDPSGQLLEDALDRAAVWITRHAR